jgi:DNA polymerase I-like protein with 3'-5' exonuclease and polymerase domains
METKYPNLNDSKLISFDIETYDPELKDKGPGVYRKDGYILGVAISDGSFNEYYALQHKDSTQDKNKNLHYLRDILSNNVPKIGAHILYDMDWLINGPYKFIINGRLNDVQIAEPLICEFRKSFSLESLSETYLHQHKKTDKLLEYCKKHNIKTRNPREFMYLYPFALVREYAKTDAYLPIHIFMLQLEILKRENLYELYRMEIGLLPMLLQMRRTGVRLNVNKVNKKISYLNEELRKSKHQLKEKYGELNVKSTKQIAKILDSDGVEYERHPPTEIMLSKGITIGNPKLDKDALKLIDHPLVEHILKIREYRTILDMFFINSYTELRVKDRIHALFNPLKSDDYGTVSGRFSSTKPNLQQQPSKEETMGRFCREVFVPEEDCVWAKLDWSQIEYRLIAHYARGPKSELIRSKYNNDPKTDYHQMIMDWTGLDRTSAKRLNFGMAYFMGVWSCSKKFGWSLDEAKEFIDHYHSEVPFVKETRAHVVKVAKIRGYIKTILKRRARISPYMLAEKKEYSIFNRLVQGSAADLMKKAMYDSYNAGIFNVLHPHLIVHDEIDSSVPKTKEGAEAMLDLKNIMENCVKLKVPIIADLEIGPDWGNVSEENVEEFLKGVRL